MRTTRTGAFPIGFRRGWSEWQKDINSLIAWSVQHGLGVLDLGADAVADGALVSAAGLTIGSADLKKWTAFTCRDTDGVLQAVEENDAYIGEMVALGCTNFFAVLLPEDAELPRHRNYGYAVQGLRALAPVLEKHGARLVLEGWPGNGALACTPETIRALIHDVGSEAIGLNYDPSHLIRMGIDPIRFLREFAPHVFHVHGKDTEIDHDAIYECGTEQPTTLRNARGFGSTFWRYTIPGHGEAQWVLILSILRDFGYRGAISIELEDENFNGSEEGEKRGLLAGARFLEDA